MPDSRRHHALGAARARSGADALLLTDPADVRWACGFTGSNGWLLWTPWVARFVTDGRYAEQATREVVGADITAEGGDLARLLAGTWPSGVRSAAFSADRVTVDAAQRLGAALPDVRWISETNVLGPERAVKYAVELEAIERAQRISEAVFLELLERVRPGVSERELAAEITWLHLRRGAERMSFDPIVASGPNSALPHARPTRRILEPGDVLLLDFGCVVDGYASDMTRMVSLGHPRADVRRVHALVREAVEAAEEGARAGLTSAHVDALARTRIDRAGYGSRFPHSLGHGVGLDIHEWPSVSFRSKDVLPAGCVLTIEPGIYLEGDFGVRIEDMVVLRDDGIRRLTDLAHDLVTV